MTFIHFAIVVMVLQLVIPSPVFYYKKLTPEEAARLAAWTPDSKQFMWELSGQYQGDMVLTPNQRNGILDTRLRWYSREIPYELSGDFSDSEKRFIVDSLEGEFGKTCIKVRPRTAADVDYVYVTGKDTGCWSYVGRLGGRQELNLQRNGCLWRGTVAHEFLHAAGFYHQQSATERDDFVNIYWKNIIKGYEYAFDKYGSDFISSFGEKYDYDSVMHYGKYAFSSNAQPTILPKNSSAEIGQIRGLSDTDIVKLNKMYSCV